MSVGASVKTFFARLEPKAKAPKKRSSGARSHLGSAVLVELRPDFCTLPICENSSCERREASDDWERGFSVRVPFGVRLRGCPRRCVGVNLEPRSELAVFSDLRGSEKSSRVLSVIGLARSAREFTRVTVTPRRRGITTVSSVTADQSSPRASARSPRGGDRLGQNHLGGGRDSAPE